MTITGLRLLPPLAIGRMGSAITPLESYTVEVDPYRPLDFRTIVGAETLVIDDDTGAVAAVTVPTDVTFREGGRIKPVAPFLEVFAVTDGDVLEPLTLDLLREHGATTDAITWNVTVANRKVARRTGDPRDVVGADTGWFGGHEVQRLDGRCENFVDGASIAFGHVRFIRPDPQHPHIRLRYTPGKGLIYGPSTEDVDPFIAPERRVYDAAKGRWYGFEIPVDAEGVEHPMSADGVFLDETLPPSLFAIAPPAPSWLHGNVAKSRGYLDDACDGIVGVALVLPDGTRHEAAARITASPPALVPDALFVRSLADDLEQVISGPSVADDEPHEVTLSRAEEIVRRAFETVRFMNVAVMNGDVYEGRPPLSLDTMPAEEAFDTDRAMRPVMAPRSVDTLSVMALHQQVYAALRGGASPWFLRLLRRPDEVGDFTDDGRRKMPALMCGADGNYLALTWRQIDTIRRLAERPSFVDDAPGSTTPPALTPRNRTAQLHHGATGNPHNSKPTAAVANCTPGLEVDFRAVWRRVFEGITLREYDNLVTQADDPSLVGRRLLRINGVETSTVTVGPSPADPAASVVLATAENPDGLAPLEWSNALAAVLAEFQGRTVRCDFTIGPCWDTQQAWSPHDHHLTLELRVRHFFDGDTAFISRVLAEPGELTQGLCSPWQNDFRECSCYYWASARPDFVNVEPGPTGTSEGDNWMQKERSGRYVPDDYVDTRLVDYDDLFEDWEGWLRFQLRGRDAPGER